MQIKKYFWFLWVLLVLTFGSFTFSHAKKSEPLLHFIQISDTHLEYSDEKDGARLLGGSEVLLRTLVDQINKIGGIDFVLSTGDLVNKPDRKLIEKFIEITNLFKYPHYVLLGNHDATNDSEVKKAELIKIFYEKGGKRSFSNRKPYYSFSPNDKITVICLDGSVEEYKTSNGLIDDKQLAWLKKELDLNKNKKIIIALHYPVFEPFESVTHYILEPGRTKLLNFIDSYPNIIGVFTGHYHAAKLVNIKNRIHNSCPAIVEYPCAFREVIIEEEDPEHVTVDFKWHVVDEPTLVAKSKKHSDTWRLKEGAPEDREQKIKLKVYKLLP